VEDPAVTALLVLLALAGLAASAVAWLARSERRRAESVLELAARLEAQHAYEAACFHYAVAASAGADRATCETKVRDLWNAHGPFPFADTAEELRAKYCEYESCGEGFHEVTVQDVRRIVEAGQPPPSTS
jgi:hypothetical protein